MRVVTGGSGVLGRALIRALRRRGHRVLVLDMKPPPDGLLEEVIFVRGSVLDRGAVDRALAGAEVVHHLAASMPQAPLGPRGFWEINVGGTINVAEAALQNGLRRMVFASSIEVYGLQYPHEFPVREEAEKRFTGIYSRNKFECEQRLLTYRARGLEVVFPRMPMIFGPGFYHEASMMQMFDLIHRNLPLPVLAAPEAPWASVASADAGEALARCDEVPAADGEAMNIAAADAPPCRQALTELIDLVGSRSRLLPVPRRLIQAAVDLIQRFEKYSPTPAELAPFILTGGAYSIDKARRVLGYKPQFSAVQAMAEAYHYLHPPRAWDHRPA